jgi:hypothetical protein
MGIPQQIRSGWKSLLVGSWDPKDPSLWPTASQQLLLRAIVLDGDRAVQAWQEWCASNDVQSADDGSRALFPRLFKEADRLGVDAEHRGVLRTYYSVHWAQNQKAIARLSAALEVLEKAGVPVIALKGAPLLLFYYGNAGVRVMADIDVLIQERDLARASDVLRAHDWHSPRGLPPREIVANIHAAEWTH